MLSLTIANSRVVTDAYPRPGEAVLAVAAGDEVAAGGTLFEGPDGAVTAEHPGVVDVEAKAVLVRRDVRSVAESVVPAGARLRVREGDAVEPGEQLTEGAQNPHSILSIVGVDATQAYLLEEIQKVYRSQGVTINDKHVEIIVRQMLGKVRVLRPGDSKLLPGDLVDLTAIELINVRILERGGRPATYHPVLLGITKASLETDSLLSAASFQHTITILAKAAIEGKTDRLVGLKENVIIGKLIPAGTGFQRRDGSEVDGQDADGDAVDLDLSEEALAELLEDELDLDKLALAETDEDFSTRAAVAVDDDDDDEDEDPDAVVEADSDDEDGEVEDASDEDDFDAADDDSLGDTFDQPRFGED